MEQLLLAGTFVFLFILAVGLILYLLQAIGLYTIGKRMGIELSWFAFIPGLNFYVLGEIVSQVKVCDYVIGHMGLVLPISILVSGVMTQVPVLGVLLSLAVFILYILVLLEFFRLFNPENAIVKTVVSIVLPFMLPIFLFLMRNDEVKA